MIMNGRMESETGIRPVVMDQLLPGQRSMRCSRLSCLIMVLQSLRILSVTFSRSWMSRVSRSRSEEPALPSGDRPASPPLFSSPVTCTGSRWGEEPLMWDDRPMDGPLRGQEPAVIAARMHAMYFPEKPSLWKAMLQERILAGSVPVQPCGERPPPFFQARWGEHKQGISATDRPFLPSRACRPC